MTGMELLAVPAALAHISGLVICPECVGGVLPERYVSVKGSALERAIGSECASCRGTGIDPQSRSWSGKSTSSSGDKSGADSR